MKCRNESERVIFGFLHRPWMLLSWFCSAKYEQHMILTNDHHHYRHHQLVCMPWLETGQKYLPKSIFVRNMYINQILLRGDYLTIHNTQTDWIPHEY